MKSHRAAVSSTAAGNDWYWYGRSVDMKQISNLQFCTNKKHDRASRGIALSLALFTAWVFFHLWYKTMPCRPLINYLSWYILQLLASFTWYRNRLSRTLHCDCVWLTRSERMKYQHPTLPIMSIVQRVRLSLSCTTSTRRNRYAKLD